MTARRISSSSRRVGFELARELLPNEWVGGGAGPGGEDS